jgi:OOP family OmpA-OmpF porin
MPARSLLSTSDVAYRQARIELGAMRSAARREMTRENRQMNRALSLGLSFALITTLPLVAVAQDVRDMTGHEPTSNELIDALKPRPGTMPEGVPRMRGFGAVQNAPAPTGKPQCKPVAAKRDRGIGAASAAVSDVAAIKVEFAFNSAELTPQATKTLDELGKALTSNDLKVYCFVVEGHTDSIGSDAYNMKLSQQRAQSVVHYLTKKFDIDPDRLQAVGVGKASPIASNDTDEGRQKNRRVQIANIGA